MRRTPPASVIVALASLTLVIVLQVALTLTFAGQGQVGWAMYAFAALLWGLLFVGLLRRSRLAWLWTRYLSIVLGAVLCGTVATGLVRHELPPGVAAIAVGALALPLFVAGIALGRPSTYPYFDLVCPTCSARTGLGSDLLFRQARCRVCQTVW